MDDHSVTISGRPDVLDSFASFNSPSYHAHKTTVSTLYHCSENLRTARDAVLVDISRRHIHFPKFSDIVCPIYSTVNGEPLRSFGSETLLKAVVDMVMLEPVNWDYVVRSVTASIPSSSSQSVRLINFGPGSGLLRTFERSLARSSIAFEAVDLTSSGSGSGTTSPEVSSAIPVQEPIAVVGMAVNMPGAPDVSALWRVLEQGLNTVAEVCAFRSLCADDLDTDILSLQIPEHRFKVSDYHEASASASSKSRTMRAHTGNFIDDPDAFDYKFFKISPREARSLDPQQRVLLHTAYEALEDAGYVPDATETWKRDTFGCYVGVATGDYVQNLRNDIDVYYSTGKFDHSYIY